MFELRRMSAMLSVVRMYPVGTYSKSELQDGSINVVLSLPETHRVGKCLTGE
jgi:hypothetical protein